jgi:hypothetical protein
LRGSVLQNIVEFSGVLHLRKVIARDHCRAIIPRKELWVEVLLVLIHPSGIFFSSKLVVCTGDPPRLVLNPGCCEAKQNTFISAVFCLPGWLSLAMLDAYLQKEV